MPIQEHNAERRNLVVLSLMIIVFYISEARLDNTLALPLVKITFNNAVALTYLVWVVLCWFAYRYWIENSAKSRLAVLTELHNTNYGFKYYLRRLRSLRELKEEKRKEQFP